MTRFAKILTGCLALSLCAVSSTVGGTVSVRWDTRQQDLTLASDGPYTRVRLAGAETIGLVPGTPCLPTRVASIVIPPAARVTGLQLAETRTKVAEGIVVYPAQPDRAVEDLPGPFVELDATLLDSDVLSPKDAGRLLGTCRLGGYQLVTVQLNPVRYNPSRLELDLATSITATLSYDETGAPSDTVVPMTNVARDMVLELVSNPEDIDRFSPSPANTGNQPAGSGNVPPIVAAGDNTAIYLLITTNALASAFQPLVNRRTSQGKIGQIVTIETIQTTFTGVDLPDRIRNCVKHYYQDHGTLWLALGGDQTVVPPRYVEGGIPVDLYYGCLDGDWNADADAIYGEATVDKTDLAPEVRVGRIPVQTASQATAYVNKLSRFEDAAADGFSDTMLIASNLTWYTSGQARPAGFDDHDPVSESEAPMRNLYRNVIQPHWQAMPLDLLFPTYTTWDEVKCGDFGVTPEHMTVRLNWGYDYVYLWGYGNGGGSAGIDAAVGSSLTNANRPSIMYVTSSSTAAYDQQEPCISEAFLRNPNGGAVAFLGATRSAASTDYHATLFFKEVFQSRRATVGEAFSVAMANEAPVSDLQGQLAIVVPGTVPSGRSGPGVQRCGNGTPSADHRAARLRGDPGRRGHDHPVERDRYRFCPRREGETPVLRGQRRDLAPRAGCGGPLVQQPVLCLGRPRSAGRPGVSRPGSKPVQSQRQRYFGSRLHHRPRVSAHGAIHSTDQSADQRHACELHQLHVQHALRRLHYSGSTAHERVQLHPLGGSQRQPAHVQPDPEPDLPGQQDGHRRVCFDQPVSRLLRQ